MMIQDNALTVGNKVVECNQIEIGSTSTILHSSKINLAFWFRNSDCSLMILSNAIVEFTSTYRELFYRVNNLSFSILSNASFTVTSNNGMAYNNFGTLDTILFLMPTLL